MTVQRREHSGHIRWIGRYSGPAGEAVTQWRDLTDNAGTRRVRQHLLDNLGDLEGTPVGKLTARQLRESVAKMLGGRPWADGAPLDETTVRNLGGQLTGALWLAVEDRHLMTVPKVATPKPEGRHIARAELLAPDQVFELAADARAGRARIKGECEGRRGDARFARMIPVAAGTGLRGRAMRSSGRARRLAPPGDPCDLTGRRRIRVRVGDAEDAAIVAHELGQRLGDRTARREPDRGPFPADLPNLV